MKKLIPSILLSIILIHSSRADDPKWGYLSNTGFNNQPIKSIFFFAGNWRNGVQFYDYNPSDNTGLFTLHPSDARHLGWSENVANRDFAVNEMIKVGANVINMSYWGLPGSDNWAYWAPMQTSTESHDELFDAAIGKNILIAPYIESYAATDDFDEFIFADDFPGTAGNPSPKLVSSIVDLVDRYIVNPDNALWPEKWAKVYDRWGEERYLISIIHVASNQASMTDQIFAAGFGLVAAAVLNSTGIKVGFALDILPEDNYAPGAFKATPSGTGVLLSRQACILAIQCFIPEIWEGSSDETHLINWKKAHQASWTATGIPYIHDLTPGYDGHIVFPSAPIYGNNQNWRNLQSQAITHFESNAFTFNTWNGYTEGFAGMRTVEYGDDTYKWLCGIYGGTCSSSMNNNNPTENYDKVILFPNPASDIVTITLHYIDANIVSIEIISISGNTIDRLSPGSINRDTRSIQYNTSNLANGMYYLHIKTTKSNYCSKFIISR